MINVSVMDIFYCSFLFQWGKKQKQNKLLLSAPKVDFRFSEKVIIFLFVCLKRNHNLQYKIRLMLLLNEHLFCSPIF